jgi:hypothetical protein
MINDRHEYLSGQHLFMNMIQTILNEPNPYEQIVLLNRFREQLNRLCTAGIFGASQAHACQHIVDVLRQSSTTKHNTHEESSETTSNEQHDMQKRFFCNGFIGCKNAAG